MCCVQEEDGIRDQPRSAGLGDVYKLQIQFVENSKMKYITLHVASKNVRARSIYKQFGFIEVGETSRGSIKMKKDLG